MDLSREQICQWAAQLHVQNIQDLTNFDTDYDRAWSREILWPVLSGRFPKMQQALSRTSYLMQDADEILHEVLQQDLAACGSSQTLSLVVLQQLSLARQRQLLSHWMKGEGQYRPSFEMVQRLVSEVINSREDSQAALHWNGFYYLRFQQQLHRIAKADYLPAESIQEVEVVTCVAGQCLKLPAGHFVIQPSELGLSPELLGQQLLPLYNYCIIRLLKLRLPSFPNKSYIETLTKIGLLPSIINTLSVSVVPPIKSSPFLIVVVPLGISVSYFVFIMLPSNSSTFPTNIYFPS